MKTKLILVACMAGFGAAMLLGAPKPALADGWGGSCEDLSGIGQSPGIGTDPTGGGAFTCDGYSSCSDTLIPWCACTEGNEFEWDPTGGGGKCTPAS